MNQNDIFLTYEKEVAEFKLQLIRRLTKSSGAATRQPDKSTSHMVMIKSVLASAGRPLHVSEIISMVAKKYGVSLERDSITSALTKKVRQEKLIRTGPNIFTLRQA